MVEQGIKVIIVANEENIKEEQMGDYKEFKEKVVVFTLYHSADDGLKSAFNSKCDYYKRNNVEYYNFIETNKVAIIDSFNTNANQNIRALVNAISMFEKVFNILTNREVEYSNRIFLIFLKTYYLVSQGNMVTRIYEQMDYMERTKHYVSSIKLDTIEGIIISTYRDDFFVRSLAIWIEQGDLNEENLDYELNKIIEEHNPKDMDIKTDPEKLLAGWSLEMFPEKMLHSIYDEALNNSYEGKTDLDGYIHLMQADVRLTYFEIEHTLIDWDKMEKSLDNYLASLISNENASSSRHTYINSGDLENYYCNDAKRIYKKIETFDIHAEINRNKLLDALKGKDVYDIQAAIENKKFYAFDDEICDAFLDVYKNTTTPDEKRVLFNSWREMSISIIASNQGKKLPYNGYKVVKKLKEDLGKISIVENSISERINKEFIAYLTDYLSETDDQIDNKS